MKSTLARPKCPSLAHLRYLLPIVLVLLAACGSNGTSPVEPVGDTAPESLAWKPIQRFPISEELTDIDTFGEVTIAVGSHGAVLTRTGAGGEWKVRPRATDESISKVIMIDEKNALAMAFRRVLRTNDAGESWKTVAQTSTSFQDIDMSGDRAIVVGPSTILLSGDGGQTWASPASGFVNQSYTLVAMHSEDTITVFATSLNMFRSEDGGQSWTEVAIGELPKIPRAMEFFDEKRGIAAFRNGADVMWTDDGGDTWKTIVNFGTGDIVDVFRVDDTHAFAILKTGHIHFTEDAGKTWAFTSRATVDPLSATALAVQGNDWDVVGPFGNILESRNGGSSWKNLSQGRTGTFVDIAVVDASIAFAAFVGGPGEPDGLLRTSDAGASWQEVVGLVKHPARALFSSGVGLLVGGAEISRSTDDASTWTDISPGVSVDFQGAVILDANNFVVCGSGGRVVRTENAGTSWTDVIIEESGSERFFDVRRFPATDTLVMVGEARSFRSTNRGLSWERINLEAHAVATANENLAVAVGSEILRTVNGGQTWTIVQVPSQPLRAVSFAGSKHVVAVGGSGYLLESLDGGVNWNEVELGMSSKLGTVTLESEQLHLIGGTAGMVLLGE